MKEQSTLTPEGFAVVVKGTGPASQPIQNIQNTGYIVVDNKQEVSEVMNHFITSLGGRETSW